jgi:hypothetical protein
MILPIRRLAGACLGCLLAGGATADEFAYELRYDVTLKPWEDQADVVLHMGDGAQHVRWMRFHIEPGRHSDIEGDGNIERDGEYVTWTPPDDGGKFGFSVPISRLRDDGRFDARMTETWAVFRGDDLVPPARVRLRKGAEADATLRVNRPKGWSFIAPYDEIGNGVYAIEHADRSFDRPTGWMAAGELGVRWETIEDISVAVAGPVDQGVRRLDILAFLNWNLPYLSDLVREMPDRLVVVSAAKGMWRGGLSGPRSLYLHADRPLISENGTSTLMHELVHMATSMKGAHGADWIVEGFAEFYSLELMRRSGTITGHRFNEAIKQLKSWSADVDALDVRQAAGAVKARSALIMWELDREIRDTTEGEAGLDQVLRALMALDKDVSLKRLRKAAGEVMEEPPETLKDKNLPGIGK